MTTTKASLLASLSIQAIEIIDKNSSICSEAHDFQWIGIEDFKNPKLCPKPEQTARTFRSSGTTQDERSWSHFSELGLELYRYEASVGFLDLLEKKGLQDYQIVSLVPPVEEWPESSLAQMVGWISKQHDVFYSSIDSLERTLKRIQDRPYLIFGTGFHFVNLLDDISDLPLRKDCFLIETGGTKGKSRSISKGEMYDLLEAKLHIPQEQILSEYGMCELSAQAYHLGNRNKHFRFPKHVRCFVETGINTFRSEGIGCLTVFDPWRIDLQGQAIRTQDVVELFSDQSFNLLGRSETAPLKGCSLTFEDLVKPETLNSSSTLEVEEKQTVNEKSPADLKKLRMFFTSQPFLRDLETEMLSLPLAEKMQADLLNSLPSNVRQWETALQKNRNSCLNWLLILPNTHSFAGLYPIFLLSQLGKNLSIRLPQNEKVVRTTKNFCMYLRDELNYENLELLTHQFLVNKDTHDEYDALFAFGEDKTIKNLGKVFRKKIVGYGSTFAFSAIREAQEFSLALNDFFALRRMGCLSSRFILVPEGFDNRVIAEEIFKYLRKLEISANIFEQCGKNNEARSLQHSGWKIEDFQSFATSTSSIDKRSIHECLMSSKFMVPILKYRNEIELRTWIVDQTKSLPTQKFLISSSNITGLESCDNLQCNGLGRMNVQHWDGSMQGRNLLN